MAFYGDSHWDRDSQIGIDCLLPNGIFVTFNCLKSHTIEDIKEQMWREAEKLPLFNLLRDKESYVLVYVTSKAKQVECVDEKMKLNEIRPYKPIFKVVQKEGDRSLSLLNGKLSEVIGKSISDFDSISSHEVNDFRLEMVNRCKKAIEWRNNANWLEKMRYYCPPEIISDEQVTRLSKLYVTESNPSNPNNQFLIQVQTAVVAQSGKEQSQGYKFAFQPDLTPSTIVSMSLGKRAKTRGNSTKEDTSDYILKVVGIDEYLFEEYPILRYKYIKDCFQRQMTPQLTLISIHEVLKDVCPEEFVTPHVAALKNKPHQEPRSLWEMEGKFNMKISYARNLNIGKDVNVQVTVGIYHGQEGYEILNTDLCQQQEDGGHPIWNWNQNLEFDMDFKDIPQGARLCLAIYSLYDDKTKKKKKKREQNKVALAWGNMTLIDHQHQLVSGNRCLYLWPVEDALDDVLNYLGTVHQNPNTNDAPMLSIEFPESGVPRLYPSFERLSALVNFKDPQSFPQSQNKKLMEQVSDIIDKDPLSELFEQDKELLWKYRHYCYNERPEALPKLLSAVKWNDRSIVAEMYCLLKRWKSMDPETALELLDYKFQDPFVRNFAVQCLSPMSDQQLSRYLLQLVQAVKYESFLNCELAWFLLRRAWRNIRIGHYFFWHLRSEMESPQAAIRFGLLLEAYCRGSVNHVITLEKQGKVLQRLRSISEHLKKSQEKKEKVKHHMAMMLSVEETKGTLNNVEDILNPRVKLGELLIGKCKFFDSKMRPLLLTYFNADKGNDRLLQVMFKNGDDLRQDMLTLQIISIMDQLWQQEGLDLKLTPYRCLATGVNTGFIEIVQESETIANIQKLSKKKAKASKLWDSALLMQWLQERNQDPAQWSRAGDNFCSSCAGYCVATYVLGIGDRHSDNIMVTKDGQLFHIDYGHFLGNFKSKFGVKRERVPFVLADDFTLIIDKHMSFEAFTKLCADAYLILRKRGYLFITLFAMMLQTGIPELRSVDDLNYMKDALALTVSESEARDYFRGKLQEARKKAWTTSMNWYVHGLAKDNTR